MEEEIVTNELEDGWEMMARVKNGNALFVSEMTHFIDIHGKAWRSPPDAASFQPTAIGRHTDLKTSLCGFPRFRIVLCFKLSHPIHGGRPDAALSDHPEAGA